MERVAFLIESTGQRIDCLLNPEDLEVSRVAGVRTLGPAGGLLGAAQSADDPLLFTGGGTTRVTMNLLFDVDLQETNQRVSDVRELTAPLWELAENHRQGATEGKPALVRFLWGKAWNFPCVIEAAAERLEMFSLAGAPIRSWFRLRMLRVVDDGTDLRAGTLAPPATDETGLLEAADATDENWLVHELTGAESDDGAPETKRLDQLAYEYYGDPALWRVIAKLNDITDPIRLAVGKVLRIAPSGGAKP